MKFIVNIIAFFVALPFLAFIVTYIASHWFYKDKKKAIDLAINVTTFCLFISVSIMLQVISELSSGTFITVLIFLILFGGLAFLQSKLKQSLDLAKALKSALRLWFLILAVLYVILFITGIIKSFF